MSRKMVIKRAVEHLLFLLTLALQCVDAQVPQDSCSDSSLYAQGCQLYAQNGHCQKGSRIYDFMVRHCRGSCNFCAHSPGNACKDSPDYGIDCPLYAAREFCEAGHRYHEFMTENCKKSCKFCTDDSYENTQYSSQVSDNSATKQNENDSDDDDNNDGQ